MYRIFTLCLVAAFLGCSSGDKKSSFEVADAKESKKEAKSKTPEWMKVKDKDNAGQKSLTTENSNSYLDDSKASAPKSGSTDKKETSDQTTKDSATPKENQNSSTNVDVDGSATAMLAKLLQEYQDSQKFFQEQARKKLNKEEILKIREEYAIKVEGWLKIADKMVDMKLRDKDRLTVVSLKQLAHQQLVAFNRPEHEQKLYDFGETLKDDSSREIKKIYEFIKLQKPFTQILRGNKFDEEEFFGRLDKVASYWRDDFGVYQNVETWLTQLYPINRDYFVRALEIAAKHFTQSTNTQIMARSDVLKDRLMVAKMGFDVAITDVVEGKEGAFDGLMKTASRILVQEELSSYVLMQLVQAGIQIEVKGEYEISRKYYQQIKDTVSKYSNQRLKETILRLVDTGLKRFDLLGKPLKVEGMIPEIDAGEFKRTPIDFSAYRGKVVILFFWAFDNRPSYVLLNELDKFYLANEELDLTLIGVNADREMNVISQVMAFEIRDKKRKWTHLMPATPKVLGLKSAMAQRCGVDSMPFNVIIDKEGKVDSYRVYGSRLEDTIERLTGKPVKRIFTEAKKKMEESEAKAEAEAAKKRAETEAGKKKEEPKKEEPKKEEPKKEEPKKEEPKKEEPKKEEPKKEEPKKEEPKKEEPKKEEPK